MSALGQTRKSRPVSAGPSPKSRRVDQTPVFVAKANLRHDMPKRWPIEKRGHNSPCNLAVTPDVLRALLEVVA
jgi:hypothetical protein